MRFIALFGLVLAVICSSSPVKAATVCVNIPIATSSFCVNSLRYTYGWLGYGCLDEEGNSWTGSFYTLLGVSYDYLCLSSGSSGSGSSSGEDKYSGEATSTSGDSATQNTEAGSDGCHFNSYGRYVCE